MRIPIVDQMLSLVRKQPPAVVHAPKGPAPRSERALEVLNKAPVGIATIAGDGHWLFVNDRFRNFIGYTRDDLARVTMHGITHPDDAKGELALMKRLAAREIDRYRVEKRLMAKNGRYRTLDITVSMSDDMLICIAEETAPSVLDAMGAVGVILSDDRGVITGWNAGAQAILGYRKSQIIGKNRRILYRDPDVWAGRSTGTLINAALERMELNDWRVRADGQHIWVHCSVAPFESGTTRGFVETITAVADDTTPLKTELEKRRRTEESLREAFDDLRRSSEETMTELRIMTGALRDEIDRRKAAEEELRKLSEQLAAVPVAIEVEEVSIPAPPQRTWTSIEGTTFEEVLRACGTQQRTGTLLVARDSKEKEIFFENGRLFSCASNDPEKFLAERLVASGMITEDQREKAVEIKRASQLALGRILLILGAIDEGQLVTVMREKLDAEIDELLSWTEGRYVFVDGEVPSLQLVPLRIDVEALLSPSVVFIASAKSGKVHQPTCLSAKRISGAARLEVRTTSGFERCRQCFR